jgi:hypothetical protein
MIYTFQLFKNPYVAVVEGAHISNPRFFSVISSLRNH